MRYIFYISILLLTSINNSYSQKIDELLVLGVQTDGSIIQSHFLSGSLLLGIKTKKNEQFYIGGLYRKFLKEIGHETNQFGIRAQFQKPIYKSFYGGLGTTLNYGEFYQQNPNNNMTINQDMRFNVDILVGLTFLQYFGISTGLTFSEYMPERYYLKGQSAFGRNYGNIKISYFVPLKPTIHNQNKIKLNGR
jgi:hypothetical protein